MKYGVPGAIVGSTNTAFSFTAGSVSVPGLASKVLTSAGITIEAWAALSPSTSWGGIAGFRTATEVRLTDLDLDPIANVDHVPQAFYIDSYTPTSLHMRFINSAGHGYQLAPTLTS